MKKSLYFVAAAAILFSACSNEDEVTENASNDLVPVEFDAPYLSLTRADVITNDNFKEFGVYAYEQGTTPWDVYRTSNTVPNFFYNQKVEKSVSDWTYSPIKYWSNNIGARHSIFAYAPYKESPNAVFSLANNGPAIRYTAGKDDYDLLWSEAKIDQQKTDITSKIQFTFKHALSQVAFEVSTFVDQVHDGSHTTSIIDDNTSVIIRSIKFVGGNVPSQGLLSLKDGSWTYEGMEEGVYEFAPNTIILNKDNTTYRPDPLTVAYVPVSSNNMVLPTRGEEKVNIQIVYDVVTVDKNNPKNNSTITNKITSTESFPLKQGISYKFKLDLGLTSVKFDASVDNWTNATPDKNVDLPNNLYVGLTYCSCPSATSEPTVAANTYYTDGTDYYYCETTAWTKIDPAPKPIYYNPADGKYYEEATFATLVTPDSNNYYVINGLLYKAN